MAIKTKTPKGKAAEDERRLYDPTRLVKLSAVPDFERIATGIAAVDTYTCGGVPVGTMALFSGPQGSGKTNLGIFTIAGFQRLYPKAKVLYINADNKLDVPWAIQLGVDKERVEVYRPTSTDDAHDMIYHICEKRRDVGLVFTDSLAALSPEDEIIGGQEMGLGPRMNNKFFRKMTMLQLGRLNIGKPLTHVVINQERMKIVPGQKFPLWTIPGGKQQEFQAALWVKFNQPDLHVDKLTGLPIAITMRYVLKKNQGGASGYPAETCIVTTPHQQWRPGQLLDHEFIWLWGFRLGVFKGLQKAPLLASWEDEAAAYANAKREVQGVFQQWLNGKQKATFIKEENLVTVAASPEGETNGALAES